ncbi:restriction endonuclease subunit S, partial [uncultured Megasphaera sp.]|uniref:restriction endonuclease subunit S n=1 Tax=uncultured Megasphaera sp. TaxID=165188 RepID=UPI0026704D84
VSKLVTGNLHTSFYTPFLTTEYTQKQIHLEINTGSQANIGIDSMKRHINVQLPYSGEQQKIANLFSHLDSLITLHQREYSLLIL